MKERCKRRIKVGRGGEDRRGGEKATRDEETMK